MTALLKDIDWITLAKATSYYRGMGYQYVDTPWVVDEEIANITCPEGYAEKIDRGDTLVGSAEQGFLQIYDTLEKDVLYMSVGPCFRRENADATHQPYFMKLELFSPCTNLEVAFIKKKRMMEDAKVFLGDNTVENRNDLDINGIEVGSYGVRGCKKPKEMLWSFGTGIALPRWRIANESGNR